jgi:hypothetical protein
MSLKLSNACSQYGASMGRSEYGSPMEGELCGLHRIPIDKGGYDSGGAYWGSGRPLFRVTFAEGERFFRASDRFDAWRQACEFFHVQIRVRA